MAEKTVLAIEGRFEEHMLDKLIPREWIEDVVALVGKQGFCLGGFCSLACAGTGQQINAYAAVCSMRTGGINREV